MTKEALSFIYKERGRSVFVVSGERESFFFFFFYNVSQKKEEEERREKNEGGSNGRRIVVPPTSRPVINTEKGLTKDTRCEQK